jgi:F0F1-type ATP synthase assembly protein I
MDRPFAKLASGFAIASTLGLGFAAATALGVYVGYRCDRALGWRFYGCTLVLGTAGGGAGLVFILKTLAGLDRTKSDAPGTATSARATDAEREDRENE